MYENVLLIALAFAMGGILKGATGAGAPLLAIPVLALLYDVPTAISLFAVPNLVSNIWQAWHFRRSRLPTGFLWRLALAGSVGAAIGTYVLASVESTYLLLVVAFAVLFYIGFRMMRPDWALPYSRAFRLVLPVGALAGLLQGSGGISAPVSISFLNAMKLERSQFIHTISVFFVGIALVQNPLLVFYGFLTPLLFGLSFAALFVIIAFMPVGSYLVRHVSRAAFDNLILALLAALSLKMLHEVALAQFGS